MKNNLEILYEDNHIIVVVKPFNILSQSDDTKDIDMLTLIKSYLKEKYNKPGNVYLGLIHTKKYLAIVNGYFDEKQVFLKIIF